LGFLLCLKVPLGALCIFASCKVDSSHDDLFLVLGAIIGSACSCCGSCSSLGCSGEHVFSSLVSSCSSSLLESMESSIDFLNEILSSKVTSQLISTFR
jgi:hypothetical protein